MKEAFIIKDIRRDAYFMGLNSDGKPYFGDINYGSPRQFESEINAINRLNEERQMWGDDFLKSRIIQVVKIITLHEQ